MQLQLHLHSHNCSWRPCRYFALWPVLQNLLRFRNFWATWLLLQLVGLHRGCWGGRGGAEMSWGRHNLPMVRRFCWKLSTKWRRSLHEQLRQTLGIPFLGRATCLICSLYSGGSHAGAHSCPESEKGFCRAIASGSSGSCPPGRKSLTRPCCGRIACMCHLWRWSSALLPSGVPLNGSRLKRIEEPEGIEWYSHMCQMLLAASCEFELTTCIELRACSGLGFMCMKVAIYLLYMQLLPLLCLLCAQTL